MKKTARTLALALAICLTSMTYAIAEEPVVVEEVLETVQVEEQHEVIETEETAVVYDETEVGCEAPVELVEIEDFETPLGLFGEQPEFTGTVQVQRKGEGALYYGDEVTLTADVQDANALYELRWEVNRQDDEGWKAIEGESEEDYDFVLTEDNANYEYRVVLVTA